MNQKTAKLMRKAFAKRVHLNKDAGPVPHAHLWGAARKKWASLSHRKRSAFRRKISAIAKRKGAPFSRGIDLSDV